jgi:hypothetical protein
MIFLFVRPSVRLFVRVRVFRESELTKNVRRHIHMCVCVFVCVSVWVLMCVYEFACMSLCV